MASVSLECVLCHLSSPSPSSSSSSPQFPSRWPASLRFEVACTPSPASGSASPVPRARAHVACPCPHKVYAHVLPPGWPGFMRFLQ